VAATSPKHLAFEQFALVGRAVGSGPRLELLDILAQGERSVERLAEAAHLKIGNASQHLHHLRRAGLVTSRKMGTTVIYALTSPDVILLVRALWRVAENNLAEVERIVQHFYRERDGLEPISRDELQRRLRAKSVLVLDVRPADEYAAAHLPGAVSIPVTELKRRLKEVPRGRDIVACCRGPYCVYSYEAIEILRRAGYSARRLDGGFLEWRVAGLPLTSSAAAV